MPPWNIPTLCFVMFSLNNFKSSDFHCLEMPEWLAPSRRSADSACFGQTLPCFLTDSTSKFLSIQLLPWDISDSTTSLPFTTPSSPLSISSCAYPYSRAMSSSLEAKIVVLGAQGTTNPPLYNSYSPQTKNKYSQIITTPGVGKTSLVQRYVRNAFNPSTTTSTVGASFVTKRVLDTPSDTTVRLQIWDTAGQERFRSISRLYYRGAHACLLCYDITDESS